MNRLGTMIDQGQWEELSREVHRRYEIDVNPERLRDLCMQAPRNWNFPEPSWGDGTWFMWLKKRLLEGNLIGLPGCSCQEIPDGWTTTLHIGFLSIIETAEELARLRWGKRMVSHDSLARSKIIKALPRGNVHPINLTAALVAPENQ